VRPFLWQCRSAVHFAATAATVSATAPTCMHGFKWFVSCYAPCYASTLRLVLCVLCPKLATKGSYKEAKLKHPSTPWARFMAIVLCTMRGTHGVCDRELVGGTQAVFRAQRASNAGAAQGLPRRATHAMCQVSPWAMAAWTTLMAPV
jgi:hypothetical protein